MHDTSPISTLACALALAAPALGQWSTAQLSAPRSHLAAATVGSKAMFAGGFGLGGLSDRVDVYDDATGQWSTMTLPTAVGASGAVTVGQRAYFSNGTAVDVYDDATGMWSSTTLGPPNFGDVGTAVGGHAAFAGGLGTTLAVYDEATAQWQTLALPSRHPGRPAVAALGDLTLVAGGGIFAPPWLSDFYSGIAVYDSSTNSWSSATLSTRRTEVAAVTLGSSAYFAGGHTASYHMGQVWSTTTDAVEVYDAATGTWSMATMSQQRTSLCAAAVGSKVLFAGGNRGTVQNLDDPTARVDIHDTVTGAWSTASLSVPRLHLASTTVGTKVLFAGGSGSIGAGRAIDIYDDAVGARYCSPAVVNSTGAAASLDVLGWPGSVAQGTLQLAARDLPPGAAGLFLASRAQASVAGPGGSQGTLCLGGAIGRLAGPGQVLAAGVDGRFALPIDLTALPQPTGAVAAQAGETWSFQAWYRDANPAPTSNFTDAVGVTLQ